MKKNKNNEEMYFIISIFTTILSIAYLHYNFKISIFLLISTCVCVKLSKKIYIQLFKKSIIQRYIFFRQKEKKLLKEIKNLNSYKDNIENYLKNKENEEENVKEFVKMQNQFLQYKKEIEMLEERKQKLIKIEKDISYKEKYLEGLKESYLNKENLIEKKKQEIIELSREKDKIFTQITQLKIETHKYDNKIKEIESKIEFAKEWNIERIDNLTGTQFEDFVYILFKHLGYQTSETPNTGDYGIDVIAEKNEIRLGIQCKKYAQTVGNRAIQEAYSGKSVYNCHVAIVITNNYFTKSAINQAENNNVVLWDRDKLKELIESLK